MNKHKHTPQCAPNCHLRHRWLRTWQKNVIQVGLLGFIAYTLWFEGGKHIDWAFFGVSLSEVA